MIITDPAKEEWPSACPDCGQKHLQGDHVALYSTLRDTVWEGCLWCWVKRTSPRGSEA